MFFLLHKQQRSRMILISWQCFSSLGLSWHIWGTQLLWFVLKSRNRAGWSCFTRFLPTYNLTLTRTTWLHIEAVTKTMFLLIIAECSWKVNIAFRLVNWHTANQMNYACVIRDLCLETCQFCQNVELWVSILWCIVAMDRLLKSVGQEVHALKYVQNVFER